MANEPCRAAAAGYCEIIRVSNGSGVQSAMEADKGGEIMLRFGHRWAMGEAEFQRTGIGIVYPHLHRSGVPESFQISIGRFSSWEESIRSITRFLEFYTSLLKQAALMQIPMELDIAVLRDDAMFLRNHRFAPSFLLSLAEVGICLNVTVYS